MHRADEACAIIAHYFRQLATRSGLHWTQANEQDMERLGNLLATDEEDAGDELPPYRPSASPQLTSRQTIVLDREGWEDFDRWRAERALDERVDQARRIMQR